jgi:hypothetical protein
MPYFLFSVTQKCRISDLFSTEREMWTHVRANGLCSEVIDREDSSRGGCCIRIMRFIYVTRRDAGSGRR